MERAAEVARRAGRPGRRPGRDAARPPRLGRCSRRRWWRSCCSFLGLPGAREPRLQRLGGQLRDAARAAALGLRQLRRRRSATRPSGSAIWFSLRFARRHRDRRRCALGLFLAVFLAPLMRARPWLIAVLMVPLMVAPAMVGLMYRLVLHEFVGPVPALRLRAGSAASPAFLSRRHALLDAGGDRDACSGRPSPSCCSTWPTARSRPTCARRRRWTARGRCGCCATSSCR